MDTTLFPTKGNLMLAKNTLELCEKGYELMDRKRSILIREMMEMIERAREVHSAMEVTFSEAYAALQHANITMGIGTVTQIGGAIPLEDDIRVRFRSVMGVELPVVLSDKRSLSPNYGFSMTGSSLDEAVVKFVRVRKLILDLAEIENSVYRLAVSIGKTQKRTNSLKNILIPRYENIVKTIQDVLDEKEREEFSRLKVIKKRKES